MGEYKYDFAEMEARSQRLLDGFAAAALTGHLASFSFENAKDPVPAAAACKAYEYAAAMMLERSRRDVEGVIEKPRQEQEEPAEDEG